MPVPDMEQHRRFRPIASNDPVAGSSDPVLLVNFRAGNYSGRLKNKQYREIGERTLTDAVIREKREIGRSLHN